MTATTDLTAVSTESVESPDESVDTAATSTRTDDGTDRQTGQVQVRRREPLPGRGISTGRLQPRARPMMVPKTFAVLVYGK